MTRLRSRKAARNMESISQYRTESMLPTGALACHEVADDPFDMGIESVRPSHSYGSNQSLSELASRRLLCFRSRSSAYACSYHGNPDLVRVPRQPFFDRQRIATQSSVAANVSFELDTRLETADEVNHDRLVLLEKRCYAQL